MAAQRITSSFATPERSADVLGVSKKRASKLIKWARSSASSSLTGPTVNANRESKNEKAPGTKAAK
jgi:hypothetical protein